LLGISSFFALRDAIKSARKQAGLTEYYPMDSPMTTERIRMGCVDTFTKLAVGDENKAINFRAKGSF
jgi:xanthine dehydrogenase/oxidase